MLIRKGLYQALVGIYDLGFNFASLFFIIIIYLLIHCSISYMRSNFIMQPLFDLAIIIFAFEYLLSLFIIDCHLRISVLIQFRPSFILTSSNKPLFSIVFPTVSFFLQLKQYRQKQRLGEYYFSLMQLFLLIQI